MRGLKVVGDAGRKPEPVACPRMLLMCLGWASSRRRQEFAQKFSARGHSSWFGLTRSEALQQQEEAGESIVPVAALLRTEASAVAEERKWRLRLDDLESSLARQGLAAAKFRSPMCERQPCSFSCKFGCHGIHKPSSLHVLYVTKTRCDTNSPSSAHRNTEKVEAFDQKMLDLEERAAITDLGIQKGRRTRHKQIPPRKLRKGAMLLFQSLFGCLCGGLSASLSAERQCVETAKDVKLLQAAGFQLPRFSFGFCRGSLLAEDACLRLEKQMASVTAELKFTKAGQGLWLVSSAGAAEFYGACRVCSQVDLQGRSRCPPSSREQLLRWPGCPSGYLA